MHSHNARGRAALVVAGLMLAMLGLAPGGSQAAGVSLSGRPQPSAPAKPVLTSEFGHASSHIVGSFGRNGVVTGTFTPRDFTVGDSGRLKAVGKLKRHVDPP